MSCSGNCKCNEDQVEGQLTLPGMEDTPPAPSSPVTVVTMDDGTVIPSCESLVDITGRIDGSTFIRITDVDGDENVVNLNHVAVFTQVGGAS